MLQDRKKNPTNKVLRVIVAILLVEIAICLACAVSVYPSQPGCSLLRVWFRDSCDFDRYFPIDDLVIEPSHFPFDVVIEPNEYGSFRYTIENVQVAIYASNAVRIGTHEIGRWSRKDIAKRNYWNNESIIEGFLRTPCGIRDNIDYSSPWADQFCIACAAGGHCKAVGQYQDYVSFLQIEIGSQITEEDFVEIVSRHDQKMADLLMLEE